MLWMGPHGGAVPETVVSNVNGIDAVRKNCSYYQSKCSMCHPFHTRRCWSEAVSGCRMVWSAAACHSRDNRPVAWTAECLCENCWGDTSNTCSDNMSGLSRITFDVRLLYSYLIWQLDFYVETILTIYNVCRKIAASIYTVQYEHVKWDMVGCAYVFVLNSLRYVLPKIAKSVDIWRR